MIAAALAGCATNSDSSNAPKCVAVFDPGIAQGVAGMVTIESDVGTAPDMPGANRSVTVGGMTTTSDLQGHYAIALAPGDYMTGDANENVMVHVEPGKVVRADLDVSFGSWWSLPAICP
ncbi:MAG TPA: hypothetical protein VIV58_10605 [Kofleriaceae bacterium]